MPSNYLGGVQITYIQDHVFQL